MFSHTLGAGLCAKFFDVTAWLAFVGQGTRGRHQLWGPNRNIMYRINLDGIDALPPP